MVFKCLPKEVTGKIEIFRWRDWYRITSREYAGGISSLDLEQGLDEFLPITVRDTEFGAAIRRCHDATRFVDWRTLPKKEAAKAAEREWKKKLVLWENKALEVTGCKTLKELYADASNSSSTRTKTVYAFFNSRLFNTTEFSEVSDVFPEYREFIIQQPASDEALGQAARAALDAVVHGAKPPLDSYPNED